MARKHLTEAERYETPFQKELAAFEQTNKSLETAIGAIELYHKLSRRNAICALRDYFQWKLAQEMDKDFQATQDRVAELQSKLKGE